MLYSFPIVSHRLVRYWNEHYFKALASIQTVAQQHGLSLAEIALRWISHHSLLKRQYGDAVLIGASSLDHIKQVRPDECGVFQNAWQALICEQNLDDLEKGPLRKFSMDKLCAQMLMINAAEDVLKTLDDAWFSVQPYATKYWH